MQESDANTRVPAHQSDAAENRKLQDVRLGVSGWPPGGSWVPTRAAGKCQQKSGSCGQRSSRRWGRSDLYSGHCTKFPHLIGHLRCLREELASSTGMEGVRERTGGKVIVGTLHTHNTHTHTLQVNPSGFTLSPAWASPTHQSQPFTSENLLPRFDSRQC